MRIGLVLLSLLALPLSLRAETGGVWPFWSSYAAHFLSKDGRVIDPDRNSMTTSEGQSYAMFFALVANDAHTFEQVRSWTEDNLARGSLADNLPAWSWGQSGDGTWRVLDQNSAADADLWIAYSLLQAGSLWNSKSYSRTGEALLALVAKYEVADLPGIGMVLMPGRTELFSTADHWVLNESYSPLPLLVAAAHAQPDGPWERMSAALPEWLQKASPSGFAMDWVAYSRAGFSPIAGPGDLSSHAYGSYDAIRVYLWAGMANNESPGAEKILKVFSPMAKLVARSQRPPEKIKQDGEVSSSTSPAGFWAAIAPFLKSSGDTSGAEAELQHLKLQFDKSTGLLGSRPRYYDQNLALFALGWQEKRFQFAPDGALRVRWKN